MSGPQDHDEIDYGSTYPSEFGYPGDTSNDDDDEGDALSEVG